MTSKHRPPIGIDGDASDFERTLSSDIGTVDDDHFREVVKRMLDTPPQHKHKDAPARSARTDSPKQSTRK